MSEAHHDEHDASHSLAHYNKIAGILIVLAIISALGPELGIQEVTLITAFGIAFVKAFLVIKHFMHLTVEKKYILYMLGTAIALMLVFYGGTAPDVLNHRGRNWENVAAQHEVIVREEAGGMPMEHHGEHGGEGHEAHGAEHAPAH